MSESQTMALVAPPSNDRKRVKVYELRNNDWFDRGTGFCNGQLINDESKIIVISEEQPDRKLLETTIQKDGYQKQQDTLIVWTAPGGTEMALSFQEAEGCATIWEFVLHTQQQLLALATPPDDALSDDAVEPFSSPVMLPIPELRTLADVDVMIRNASVSQQGRESLTKFVLEQDYLPKLVPLVEMAEDLEDIHGLHRLSNIVKMLILLNDTQIIEQMVSDSVILGIVGALEYDREFPQHKANHRQYLQNKSRFKEVVPIEDENITQKIHATWRLQYLKDVVLARMLDDPTFGVLNSLIFYNQVEIVQHLQQNTSFLKELFRLIDGVDIPRTKRKDAVCFLQQCCAIAKNLQAPARQSLYNNLIANGLLSAIVSALGQPDAAVRIAGTDILVAMIDHDPGLVRQYIFRSIADKQKPLTDVLVNLLLTESDLGVKAQAADAIKILLDPQQIPPEGAGRMNDQFLSKFRGNVQVNQQTESFIQDFYENGAKTLFQPLKDLEKRDSLTNLSFNEVSLYSHLVEILMYFVRNHLYRSKFFIASESITARVGQLLGSSQKHMKLTALKFFRTCLGLQDEFYYTQIMQNQIFSHIIDIVHETMPRDNLLNSACLELFEFIKRETTKPILFHVVENYRHRLEALTYVSVFEQFINRYDQCQGYGQEMDRTLFSNDDDSTPVRNRINGANERWQGVRDLDPDEEQYFNASDEEDELVARPKMIGPLTNGSSPSTKPLVDYPEDEDEEEEAEDIKYASFYEKTHDDSQIDVSPKESDKGSAEDSAHSPPERMSEKRRREEDEEDELGKLSITKRRNSSSSATSLASSTNSTANGVLRRKKNFVPSKDPPSTKKMTISLSVKGANEIEADRSHNEGS